MTETTVVSIPTACDKYGIILRDNVKLKGKAEDLKNSEKVKQVISVIAEYQLAKYLLTLSQEKAYGFDDPEYGEEYKKRAKRFEASYEALSPVYSKTGISAIY